MESVVVMVDSMNQEAEFNRIASEEFAREYECETGHRLRFKETGKPFPDAILETSEGATVRAEFVSIVLPFVWQEGAYFCKFVIRKLRKKDFPDPVRPNTIVCAVSW